MKTQISLGVRLIWLNATHYLLMSVLKYLKYYFKNNSISAISPLFQKGFKVKDKK